VVEDGLTATPELFTVAPPVENPPTAVQSVAFEEDQVSIEDCPLLIVLRDAESDTVGTTVPEVAAQEFEFALHVPLVQE